MALLRRSKDAQSEFFPGFTDIAEIGIGSLATVYRAREVGTNRQVALKLLNVRDASPRAVESFERESVALGAVSSHPNIVTLFRSFRAADDRPVLVLELCRGSVADTMVNGQGPPIADVVAMGIKVAGALETAHRAQILHRDVKPQNILITEFGEPALADFGVAMLQSSTQTTAGLFDFTTLHAAPELLEGGETSAATDVYELASSLYQLAAGRSAFRAYDGESPASVILRILRDPVQPLVTSQIPARLSDLLLYAMNKDKSQRPPTAAEFAAELATIEAEQGWPRTQFLVRDLQGNDIGLPSVTRLPQLRTRGAPPVGLHASRPPEQTPRWVAQVAPEAPAPVAAAVPASGAGRPSRYALRIDDEDEGVAVGDGWSQPRVVAHGRVWPKADPTPAPQQPAALPWTPPPAVAARTAPPAAPPSTALPAFPVRPQPWRVPDVAAFPIPPALDPDPLPHVVDAGAARAGSTEVPRWALRAPSTTGLGQLPQGGVAPGGPAPGGPAPGELTLDPMSLRRRVTIRSGGQSLSVDEQRIVLRSWWRRSSIAWPEVHGFELRFEGVGGSGTGGRIVALTSGGRVELAATRRAKSDLHDVHALLEAYRLRAQMHTRR